MDRSTLEEPGLCTRSYRGSHAHVSQHGAAMARPLCWLAAVFLSKSPFASATTAYQRAPSDASGRLAVGEEGAPGLADEQKEYITPCLPAPLLCSRLLTYLQVATPQL